MNKQNNILQRVNLLDMWRDSISASGIPAPHNLPVDDTTRIITDESILTTSRGLFSKEMSLESFLSILNPHTILEQARRSFLEKGTVDLSSLLQKSYRSFYQYQRGKDYDLSLRLSERTAQRVYDLSKKEMVPKSLARWVDQDTYTRLLLRNVVDTWKSLPKDGIPPEIRDDMTALHEELSSRRETLHIHHGYAGCGKSTAVAKILNEHKDKQACVVSLSNTICLMFKQKVKHIRHFSCTGANAALQSTKYPEIRDNDYLVLDEFSQWGYEQARLLLNLLKANPAAEVHIMGDLHQIPTFLGSGSLLYSIMDEFPQCVRKYETQYRFLKDEQFLSFIQQVQAQYVKQNNYLITTLPDEVLKMADVCITGANRHVDELNQRMFKLRFPNTRFSTIAGRIKLSDCARCIGLEVIANDTFATGGNTKIYRNERFTLVDFNGYSVNLRRHMDGTVIQVLLKDFAYKFALGYAITVNRAQGLEWENVLVALHGDDQNLRNFPALYVALSRGKNVLWYADLSGSRQPLEQLNSMLKQSFKFTNNFEEIK